ncbi:MAG TPA: Hsp20/alpha crystallin family protein [Pseudonocardiaceae bacterium]|nr:Hsp20/alpha crystallin family protein [Pseudonocardiaceae bacterium]
MTSLMRRSAAAPEPFTLFDRMDRLFGEWMRAMPMRTPLVEDVIRVDEYQEGNNLVVRAELPGIDPERDVELVVSDGMLRINAQRRMEEQTEDKGYLRHELRYGTFTRALPLPEGVSEDDITASYRDGILEIRIPLPEAPDSAEPKKISIRKG